MIVAAVVPTPARQIVRETSKSRREGGGFTGNPNPMTQTQKYTTLTADQYADLITRLDSLSQGQNEIKLELASRKYLDEKVNEMDKTLTGNGKWGFSKLRDWAMSCDEDNRYYKRFAVAMAATNIVSLAVAAFFWFVKVLPVINKLQEGGF